MNARLLILTFLIISLAVTPTFATPSYIIHSSIPVWIPHNDSYNAGPTVHFGGGVYVWTDWNDLRITKFFVEDAGFSWFNYTVDYIYSYSMQRVYTSLHTVTKVYVNDIEYAEGGFSAIARWFESYGVVHITLGGAAKPANVSIAYEIPPPAETVAITINSFDYNDSSAITAGSVMVDDLEGTQTTFYLPTAFSVLKDKTYELTFYGDADWNYTIGRNINEMANITNPYRHEFTENTALSIYYTAIVPGELLPVPIIFIFGMVGLACMFVGPIYGINKIKQHEYRHGLVWAVIITALGFSLFIAWLFGGSF